MGITLIDRDSSPFSHAGDIESVVPARTAEVKGRSQLEGAVITFQAVPGMTAEWLQRVVDCHLARNAAIGHVVPEMPDCPLVPKGVEASVTSTGTGFAVRVRSDEPAVAKEILARSGGGKRPSRAR